MPKNPTRHLQRLILATMFLMSFFIHPIVSFANSKPIAITEDGKALFLNYSSDWHPAKEGGTAATVLALKPADEPELEVPPAHELRTFYWQSPAAITKPEDLIWSIYGTDPLFKRRSNSDLNYELKMLPSRNRFAFARLLQRKPPFYPGTPIIPLYHRIVAVPEQPEGIKPLKSWPEPLYLVLEIGATNEQELDRMQSVLETFISQMKTEPFTTPSTLPWYEYPIVNPCPPGPGLMKLEQLTQNGDTGAMTARAFCAYQEQEWGKAMFWLKQAADLGDVHAQFNYGRTGLSHGSPDLASLKDPVAIQRALLAFIKKAADQNDVYARYDQGAFNGVYAEEADKILHDMAGKGMWEAQFLLGSSNSADHIQWRKRYETNPGRDSYASTIEEFQPPMNSNTVAQHFWQNNIEDTCALYKKSEAPDDDMPTEDEANKLADCDPSSFYYGIGRKQDFVFARKCAFSREDDQTLTMIYANGKGVPRNIDLALSFVCDSSNDMAYAEFEGRIAHLLRMKEEANPQDYNTCDDITSGRSEGICAVLAAGKQESTFELEEKTWMAGWDAATIEAFKKLKTSSATFAQAEVIPAGRGTSTRSHRD